MTASVAAGALGLDPYCSRQKAYRTILGTEPRQDNQAMAWGREREEDARQAYEAETGHLVHETGFWVHGFHDWLGGSPDGLIAELGVLEIKCPQTLPMRVPPAHRIQCLVNLFVTNRCWCDYFAWTPQGHYLKRIWRPMSSEKLVSKLRAFYDEYVLTKTEPPRKSRKRVRQTDVPAV
jgi:putative phage-type endonuclease